MSFSFVENYKIGFNVEIIKKMLVFYMYRQTFDTVFITLQIPYRTNFKKNFLFNFFKIKLKLKTYKICQSKKYLATKFHITFQTLFANEFQNSKLS